MAGANDDADDLQAALDKASFQAEEIIRKTTRILAEVELLRDMFLSQRVAKDIPGHRSITNSARTENSAARKMLDQLRSQSPMSVDISSPGHMTSLEDITERLECTNISSLETVWDVVKRSSGLEQLTSKFSLHHALPCLVCKGKNCPSKSQQGYKSLVTVDAVLSGGGEWLRVLGMDERRLMHEMLEKGWDWGADDESDDDSDDDIWEDLSMARTVRQLIAAARINRYNYRPPRLHIVFTKLREGSNAEIDRLISKVRGIPSQGVDIQIDFADSKFLATPPPSLETALQNLVAEDLSHVTPTLNLDCTMLIALASDVTHSSLDVQPWHRHDIRVQIQEEAELGSSLVKALYPVFRSRKLVCTAKAAERFRNIVREVATPTEAARAEILLPPAKADGGLKKSSSELVTALQALSIHSVDSDLQLPIEVLDTDVPDDLTSAIQEGRLPGIVEPVLSAIKLSDLNRQSFLYGWLHGVTTVTANNSIAKQMRLAVEEHRTNDHEAGPSIWVFPFTRALAAKQKSRPDAASR